MSAEVSNTEVQLPAIDTLEAPANLAGSGSVGEAEPAGADEQSR